MNSLTISLSFSKNVKIENVSKVCLDTPIIYSIAEDTMAQALYNRKIK